MGRVDDSPLSRACDVPTSANPESSCNDLFSNLGCSKQREKDYVFFEFVLTSHLKIYALQYRKCDIFPQYTLFKTVIGLLEARFWSPPFFALYKCLKLSCLGWQTLIRPSWSINASKICCRSMTHWWEELESRATKDIWEGVIIIKIACD